jgi:hypothetical protein
MTDAQPELTGLERLQPGATPMEKAAASQLDHLRGAGLLGPHTAMLEQLILDLARVIGLAAVKGRSAGMAMAARELREAIEQLPKGQVDSEWERIAREIAEANK